jgi:hypothetical protein
MDGRVMNLSIPVIRIITPTGIADYAPAEGPNTLSPYHIDNQSFIASLLMSMSQRQSGTGVAHTWSAPLNTCHLGEERGIENEE